MKKLLYSGLTALMLLFAFGTAKADNAKVKVELSPATWTIGTTAPQFTVTITQATNTPATEADGDGETTTPATIDLGASEGNVAVKVTLSQEGATSIEQVITSTSVDLTTTNLTAGTWNLTYALVKGDDHSTNFDGAAEMDAASTASLTVAAAPVTETTTTPTFKVGGAAKENYELAADEASVTVTIVAADGATVYYTTNGTEPSTALAAATSRDVVITSACTLKAIAVETGKNASAVAFFEVTKATATEPEPTTPAKDTVTVSLSAATWEMGKNTSLPKVNVAIKGDNNLQLGTKAENIAVMAILKFTGVTPDTMFITSTSAKSLLATQLTKVGEWALEYQLVRGNSTKTNVLALHADTVAKLELVTKDAVKLTVEKGTLPKPTFSPKSGAVDAGSKVIISCTNKTAKIYYTTGSAEFSTTAWTEYTDGVPVTEAVEIKAIAIHEEWNNSPIASESYTIAVLPADEAGAPALTFTPATTDSVDNNTEIMISGAEGYTVEFGTYSSISAANRAVILSNTYGVDGYPRVTEDEPILVVCLTNQADESEMHYYYRAYKVRPASDVPMPMIMSENAMAMEFGLYSKGEKIKIVAGDADAIWYTTDGSKPAIDGATSTKIEGDAYDYTLNASVTIKAIAVKDGKASDVAVARFKLYEDATATLTLARGFSQLDSIVGKNSPITVQFVCEESPMLASMLPFTLYYTLDGETEPTKDAYEAQGKTGAIKKVEGEVDEYGYASSLIMVIGTEGATTVKAKAYMHVYMEEDEEIEMAGLDEWIVSQTLTKAIDSIVYGLKDPVFTVESGEVRIGDTIRIKNLNEIVIPEGFNEEEDEPIPASRIYFSVNGMLPTSDKNSIIPTVVYRTSDEEVEDVVIIIGEDEDGTYAYIPLAEQYYDGSEKVYFEDRLPVQAICYDAVAYGVGFWGRPGQLEYGSNFVEASYTVMKDFPKPVITPNGGIVSKGEEVEITAGEGLDIYYTTNDSVPEVGKAFTKKYEGPVVVNEALTLKAIAFKKGAEGARDSVSAVAVAVFTLVPEIAVKAVGHTVVNDSVIFADGNVAFDMFIKEFTEADRVFKLNVTVWNTANEEDFPLADEFEAADSVRFVNTYYNGKYEATFALMQPDRRGGYVVAQDTTIIFYVTENEEVVDNYELTVKPVGVAEGEKVVFTTEEVAFDVFVKGLAENNDLKLQAIIYTKAEYDSMKNVEPKEVKAAADSVRFSTKLADGEYVGMIQLTREIRGEVSILEEASCAFTVKKKDTTAVETRELAGVNVYPNPTDGEFNVVAPAAAQVEIFNAAGVLVKRVNVSAGVNAMRLENSGIYFVRVRANGQMAVKKVVIR